MSLDDLVKITITKTAKGVTQVGFGYGMVLGVHLWSLNRLEWITKAAYGAELVALGFSSTDAIYMAIVDHFSQNPAPTKVAVGRIQSDQITVAIDVVQNTTHYIITIESAVPGTPTTIDFTSDADATQAEIADGIVALITASAETSYVTATNVSDDVKIVLDTTSPMVVRLGTGGAALMSLSDPEGTIEDADTALAAIVLEDDDWYGLMMVDRTSAQVLKAAAWVETKKKLFFAASSDANIINQTVVADTTSIAAKFKSLSYARSAAIYHSLAATEYADAAWLGKGLPYDPGSITWMFKTLASITADTFTATQLANLAAKYCNWYETIAGVSIMQEGKVGANEWIDITRGIDWLSARLQEYIYALLVGQLKVPYTQKGIDAILAEVRRVLKLGIDNNFLASITSCEAPDIADVPAADKTNRILKEVKFEAPVAGAIHELEIEGVVTV